MAQRASVAAMNATKPAKRLTWSAGGYVWCAIEGDGVCGDLRVAAEIYHDAARDVMQHGHTLRSLDGHMILRLASGPKVLKRIKEG